MYRLSRQADQDLEYILDCTVVTFGVDQATRYYEALRNCLTVLDEQPGMGRAVEDMRGDYRVRAMGPRIELKEVEPGTEAAVWGERLLAWAESGLAQVEFCRLHGLSPDQFRRHRTRLRRRSPDPKTAKSMPPRPNYKVLSGVAVAKAVASMNTPASD